MPTPVNFSQSFTYRDNRGFTGITRLHLHTTDESVTPPHDVAVLVAGLLSVMTNGALASSNGGLWTAPVLPPTFGAGTEFPNAEDVAHLIFTTGISGQIVKMTIPCPVAGIFLTTDYRTVDPTNASVIALVNRLTGVTDATNYMISPTSLAKVTSFIAGYRKRNRLDRRRVNNYTLAHP